VSQKFIFSQKGCTDTESLKNTGLNHNNGRHTKFCKVWEQKPEWNGPFGRSTQKQSTIL